VRVAVSGGGGFIGSHLAARLRAAGHDLCVLEKRRGDSTATFPRLEQLVYAFAPDVFVHLGANCSTRGSLADPRSDFIDNAVGTFNVCEVSRRHGAIPILFMSSVKVQPGADGLVAPMGLSKQTGEAYVELYGRLYGVPYIIDRPSTIYGPGQDGTAESGWFTWFIRAALTGQRIEIAGDGTQSRDVLYIDDAVEVLVDQVENFPAYAKPTFDIGGGPGRTYDVGGGPGNEVSLNELLAELGYLNTARVPRLPGDLQRVVTDNTALTQVHGWEPKVGWREGLALTRDRLREEL
jgi:nucleoside-diphosphate-sugar epimerase